MSTGKKTILLILALVLVIGGTYLYRTRKSNSVPQSAVAPSEMKTYTNSEYAFSIQYPARFFPTPRNADSRLAIELLTSKFGERMTIDVLDNVDIYRNEEIVKVATREVMNAGYKYTVSPTTLNGYSSAITNMDVVTTKDNINTQTTTVTIKHPKNNLYVVFVLPRVSSPVEFEEMFSTFKFTAEPDQMIVKNLVYDFYADLEAREGKLLFSLMTPPVSVSEKADFGWLTGTDLVPVNPHYGEPPLYRVFFRQNINISSVDEVLMMDANTYSVKATDNLTGTPSAGSEDKIFKPIPRKTVLTVIKSGDTWLIDKFTNSANTKLLNTSTLKYSGFEQ